MKIKKVFIHNFKGIESKRVITLDADFNFFIGPNGFWKTTIFDAIEICLTWKLHRIEWTELSKIIPQNKKISKRFYQNKEGCPILLKVLLEDEENIYIIFAYDEWEKKSIKPWTLYFERFFKNYKKDKFDYSIFNKDNLSEDLQPFSKVEESKIFQFQYGETMQNIYPLFNYLQQEESTFFLKQTEKDRRKSLDFLFWIENESKDKTSVLEFSKFLTTLSEILKKEINSLAQEIWAKKENIEKVQKITYKKFFNEEDIMISEKIFFDKRELFGEDENENKKLLQEYLENLNKLVYFLENFDIKNFENYNIRNFLESIYKDENFLKFFLLQDFSKWKKLKELESFSKIKELLKDKSFLEFIFEENNISKNFKKIEIYYKLYNLAQNNEKNALKYFLLSPVLENDEKMKKLEKQYNLYNISNKDLYINNFLLKSFKQEKKILEKETEILQKIEEKYFLEGFLLRKYFTKENNQKGLSQYEKLKYIFDILEKYEKGDFNEKVKLYEKVYSLFCKTDNSILGNFQSMKLEYFWLISQSSQKIKVISHLNDLRNDLFHFFKQHIDSWDIPFQKDCIFCGAKKVNKKLLTDFDIYKQIIHEKTWKIKNLLDEDGKILQKVKDKIQVFLEEIEKEIVKFKKENISIYNIIFDVFATENDFFLVQEYYEFLEKKFWDEFFQSVETFEHQVLDMKKKIQQKFRNSKFILERISDYNYNYDALYLIWIKDKVCFTKNNFNVKDFSERFSKVKDKIDEVLNDFDKNLYENIKKYPLDKQKWMYFIQKIKSLPFYEKLKNCKEEVNFSFSKKLEELSNIFQNELIQYVKLYELKIFGDRNIRGISIIKNFLKDYNIDYHIFNTILDLENSIKTTFNNWLQIFNFLQKRKNYQHYFNALEKIWFKYKVLISFDDYSKIDLEIEKIRWEIEKKLDSLNINMEILFLDSDILNNLFNKDMDIIKKYQNQKHSLLGKKDYIEYKFFQKIDIAVTVLTNKKKKLEARLEKINNSNIQSLEKLYTNTIKEYKEKIVKKIQLPFFIYTAKILQNFQQWFWIFMWIKTENAGWESYKNESIVFSTMGEENDIMHQLSSGQLSVVAIAFLLAVNKVYHVHNLETICIDDPTQEMDSLNIYSLIDLLRYNFWQNFSYIMSTHIDNNAYFMKYKIEKLQKNSVQILNVQNELSKKNDKI